MADTFDPHDRLDARADESRTTPSIADTSEIGMEGLVLQIGLWDTAGAVVMTSGFISR